ncbi:MAG: hypothetical protein H6699_03075 [Myxococcales bacterium]|nr:hypothetical protein [Myxococcales bacterium]
MNARSSGRRAQSLRAPDAGRLASWLASSDVVCGDGAVMSWSGPRGGGYAYPEVAGLWLAAVCGARLFEAPAALVDRVADRLVADVTELGGVGRRGRTYLFDTAVAANGLGWYSRSSGGRHSDAVARLVTVAAGWVVEQTAVLPEPDGDPSHWSNGSGPHQLKAAVGLHNHGALADAGAVERALDALGATQLAALRRDGPTVGVGATLGYAHAAAYAIEGATFLARVAGRASDDCVSAGAARLAALQGEEGGIHAWFDGSRVFGSCHADATAQAVRLWATAGADRWAREIERALGWLADAQAPSGAVRYASDCEDENTWASLFTLQALRWLADGVDWVRVL